MTRRSDGVVGRKWWWDERIPRRVVRLRPVHQPLQAPADVLDHAGELSLARRWADAEREPALLIGVATAVQREDVNVDVEVQA
jgi:hypothetical protein